MDISRLIIPCISLFIWSCVVDADTSETPCTGMGKHSFEVLRGMSIYSFCSVHFDPEIGCELQIELNDRTFFDEATHREIVQLIVGSEEFESMGVDSLYVSTNNTHHMDYDFSGLTYKINKNMMDSLRLRERNLSPEYVKIRRYILSKRDPFNLLFFDNINNDLTDINPEFVTKEGDSFWVFLEAFIKPEISTQEDARKAVNFYVMLESARSFPHLDFDSLPDMLMEYRDNQ